MEVSQNLHGRTLKAKKSQHELAFSKENFICDESAVFFLHIQTLSILMLIDHAFIEAESILQDL